MPLNFRLRHGLAVLVAVAPLAVDPRVASGQASLPRSAASDMSRVAVLDTTMIPPLVPREFRGVWVSSADGGDWPSRAGLPAATQQAELISLLERARAIGLNAVIFHVRLSGDALYATPFAPWSAKLTGTQGEPPGYDPLALVVREAHARGLQVHAWFNPFRASLDGGIRAAPSHVTRTHPLWVRRYGPQLWIDPGLPEAREAVVATILDVVQRYDVDGVHIDDFFYPYRETRTTIRRVGKGKRRHTVRSTRELDFPDAASWRRYGSRERWTDRQQWRRNNIDQFIATLYRRVHETKPWVLVGVSPFGIWRTGTPAGVEGMDAYRETYADARKWLRHGWVDYLAPQLYWPLEGPQNRFRALDAWWRTQNPLGRSIWPGLYTAGAAGRGAWPLDEIPRQIAALRLARESSDEPNGHIHCRIGSLAPSGGQLASALAFRLETESYRTPALIPETQWLGGTPPAAPVVVLTEPADAHAPLLLIAVRDSTPLSWWMVQTRGANGRWSTVRIPATTRQLPLPESPLTPDRVVLSAIDRMGRTSPQTTVQIRRPR
ncbi:MAG: glycoside hydrolase family 10 protein [Gemmatimonadaceae bacterium]